MSKKQKLNKKLNDIRVQNNHKGRGVYASKDFKKGAKVIELKGREVTPKTLFYQGNDFRSAIINPLQIGTTTYLDLKEPYLLFNHSCDPNCGLRGRSTLFAIKTIKKDDELTFDYSTSIDETFDCRCGSKKCRGAIVDFFGLPRKVQKYYGERGALPQFIMRKYKQRYHVKKSK